VTGPLRCSKWSNARLTERTVHRVGWGGFGLNARPVGAFVIKGDEVTWQPAIDINRAIIGGQIVAVVAVLTLRAVIRMLAKRQVR